MDHFIGFDAVVRVALGRGKTLRLYGPPGLIDNVNGKLRGYTWNLVDGYPLSIEVREFGPQEIRHATFHAANGFRAPEPAVSPLRIDTRTGLFTILEDPMFTVKAVALNHRVPSFAYALEERFHINVNKQLLHEAGLPVGGWLKEVKQYLWEGKPEEFRFTALLFDEHRRMEREFVLGDFARQFLRISRGQKLAYVVDARYDEDNEARIVALAKHADLFYCESPYLNVDAEKARDRYHLTARQAGIMARKASVRELIVFHFSPRYTGQGEAIEQEAQEAFRQD
jgi:ribonuclease Z